MIKASPHDQARCPLPPSLTREEPDTCVSCPLALVKSFLSQDRVSIALTSSQAASISGLSRPEGVAFAIRNFMSQPFPIAAARKPSLIYWRNAAMVVMASYVRYARCALTSSLAGSLGRDQIAHVKNKEQIHVCCVQRGQGAKSSL